MAALLITKQVVGNIKESLIPYFKKQFKHAKLSYDRYGALSPTEENSSPDISTENSTGDNKKTDGDVKEEGQAKEDGGSSSTGMTTKKPSPRSFSQVECESSSPAVGVELDVLF